jgi:CubicO group peptidase (beta-lactamase class C family)
MQRAVLAPLGMRDSTFAPLESGAPNLATNFDADGNQIPYRKFSATSAAGLFATASDMARLIEMHRPGADGSPPGRGVVKPSTLEEMRKPHGYAFGTDIWGLGVLRFASNNQGDSIVGHDGENYPAVNTTARFDPATGDGIIVLTDGAPGISDRLGSEWIFWRTGNVDKPTVLGEAPQTALIVLIGWLLILGVGGTLAWRARKRAKAAL